MPRDRVRQETFRRPLRLLLGAMALVCICRGLFAGNFFDRNLPNSSYAITQAWPQAMAAWARCASN